MLWRRRYPLLAVLVHTSDVWSDQEKITFISVVFSGVWSKFSLWKSIYEATTDSTHINLLLTPPCHLSCCDWCVGQRVCVGGWWCVCMCVWVWWCMGVYIPKPTAIYFAPFTIFLHDLNSKTVPFLSIVTCSTSIINVEQCQCTTVRMSGVQIWQLVLYAVTYYLCTYCVWSYCNNLSICCSHYYFVYAQILYLNIYIKYV